MSTKSETIGQLFYEIDGERKPLEIGELSLEDCSGIVCDAENAINNPEYFKGVEITFKMSQKSHKQLKKVMQSIFPRYFTNNWRKMHHFPMIRRGGKMK